MCGIFGVLQKDRPIADGVLRRANEVQAHRGPDDTGLETFNLRNAHIALGHQRLAIIDLSSAGHQPMAYRGDQGCLIYNGELYNYIELREELKRLGEEFSTQSDTEVVIAALHRWGPRGALGRFNWMGAIAWLDRSVDRIVLARDPGSEKPLYYSVQDQRLIFASELKTLLTLSETKFELNRNVIGQFLHQGLTDASPQTFFSGIHQLPAGTYAEIPLFDGPYDVQPIPVPPPPYPGDPATMSLDDFIAETRRLFTDSVRVRLRSDVPVGVLLSGGIDSSSIAAVAHGLAESGNAPQLLSMVSDDPRFDESVHIGAVERHLGQTADRITIRPDPKNLTDELAHVNWHNDSPVFGLQMVGYYRIMERAKELGLTVILSGQGADESLLGYRKYLGFYLQSLLRQRKPLRALGVLARFALNRSIVNQFELRSAKRYVPAMGRLAGSGKGQSAASAEGGWLKGWEREQVGLGEGSVSDRQRLDITKYSVPALCHYEDRLSMALSREIRLPFLDSRLVDLMLRAPDNYKIRNGWTKYALRRAMEDVLPPEIVWRKDKKGFANPQGEWLKDELKGLVLDAFDPTSRISQRGIINSDVMLRRYEAYRQQPINGGMIWYFEIFAPLSLDIWMRQFDQWIA